LLVLFDGLEGVETGAEGHEFGEVGDEVGEEPLDVVHHLVEGEVCDGDVAEVPVVLPTVALDFCQFGQDLLLPVELWRLLGGARGLGVGAVHLADESDDVVLDVVLALEHVESDAVAHAVAQQREAVGLAHQVLNDAVLPRDHEVAVLEEGQSLYYPLLGLRPLELLPLLRREEVVAEGQLQVLAQQPAHLRLRPDPEVTDHHALLPLRLHPNNLRTIIA
jgi:hypothetical protein